METRNKWSPPEEEFLKRMYPRGQWKDILAGLPGKSVNSIRSKVKEMGIRREKREPQTEECKRKISEKNRGKTMSLETRMKHSVAMRGPKYRIPKSVCVILHEHGNRMERDPDRLDSEFILGIIGSIKKARNAGQKKQ